jgi:hypothetical protein
MSHQLNVMISSTARDLPEHRKEVMDACLRQGMFPDIVEHLPPDDAESISASLKMVDNADAYALILAHRYGHVPQGQALSVTEMEYNRCGGAQASATCLRDARRLRRRTVKKNSCRV